MEKYQEAVKQKDIDAAISILKAVDFAMPNAESPMKQAEWYVPIYPGEAGTITANTNSTRINMEAVMGR